MLSKRIGRPVQAHGVNSEAQFRLAAKRFLGRHGKRPVLVPRVERPAAYISASRWVVDCDCGNSPSASPEWGLAVCYECGAEYSPIFPGDMEEAEKALLRREVKNRHYFPSKETAEDLKAENSKRGVR